MITFKIILLHKSYNLNALKNCPNLQYMASYFGPTTQTQPINEFEGEC